MPLRKYYVLLCVISCGIFVTASFALAQPTPTVTPTFTPPPPATTMPATTPSDRDTPANVDARLVTVDGSIYIRDDDLFTSDEKETFQVHAQIALDKNYPQHEFFFHKCVGDEVVGEIRILAALMSEQDSIQFGGVARLLEEESCDTDEVDDLAQIQPFTLLPGEQRLLDIDLKNDEFGGGDDVQFALMIQNQPISCESSTVDRDCDGFSDEVENFLIQTFKPVYAFDENEPTDVMQETALLYQITPVIRSRDGQSGALITAVLLYPSDDGLPSIDLDGWDHVTCGPVVADVLTSVSNVFDAGSVFGSHAGDSEAVRLFVANDGIREPEIQHWQLDEIQMKRHFDPWETYPDDTSLSLSGSFEFLQDEKLGIMSHPVIYVSQSKHAQYPDANQCESYSHKIFDVADTATLGLANLLGDFGPTCEIHMENCAGGQVMNPLTPPEHNVGERHAMNFDQLSETGDTLAADLFGAEHAWTSELFCGGEEVVITPSFPETEACAGGLGGKWWAPEVINAESELAYTLNLGTINNDIISVSAVPGELGIEFPPTISQFTYSIIDASTGGYVYSNIYPATITLSSGTYEIRDGSNRLVESVSFDASTGDIITLNIGRMDISMSTDLSNFTYNILDGQTGEYLFSWTGSGSFSLLSGNYRIQDSLQREFANLDVMPNEITQVNPPVGQLVLTLPEQITNFSYNIIDGQTGGYLFSWLGSGTFVFLNGNYQLQDSFQREFANVVIHIDEISEVNPPVGQLDVNVLESVANPSYNIVDSQGTYLFSWYGEGTFDLLDGNYELQDSQSQTLTTATVRPGEVTTVTLSN